MKNSLYNDFCEKIISLDKTIRFVGFSNESGVLMATAFRSGLTPLMTTEETSHYAIQAVTRAILREDFTAKLGKIEYSITKYLKLIRALIPYELNDSKVFMLLTFDIKSNPIEVIEKKVLPYLESHSSNR